MPHTPIVGPEANTQEWLDYRSKGIGASESAAAAGLSEYQTPFGLYCAKLGLLPPFEGNEATRRGKRVEPLIVQDWEEKNERKVQYPAPMFIHPEKPFLFATPDAIVSDSEGLECKNTTWRQAKRLGEEGSDFILPDWSAQASHQMAVMGWEKIYFAVWVDMELRQYVVPRDEEFIKDLLEAETELWQRIEAQDPPDPNWSHPATFELIRSLYGVIEGRTIELDREAAIAWARQEDLKNRISYLEAERDAERAKVLYAMEESAIGRLPGGLLEIVRLNIKASTFTVNKKASVRLYERKARK